MSQIKEKLTVFRSWETHYIVAGDMNRQVGTAEINRIVRVYDVGPVGSCPIPSTPANTSAYFIHNGGVAKKRVSFFRIIRLVRPLTH